MPNAGQLIDEVLGELQGYNSNIQQITTLSAPMLSTDMTFTVSATRSGIQGITPGVVEIDSELTYVSNVDPGGTITVLPGGRGWAATTATAHAPNVFVTSQPEYPRQLVLNKVNDTILRVFPDLFGAAVATFTTTFPQVTYDLPDTASWVLDARWQPPGPTKVWAAVTGWRMSQGGTTVAGDPGVSVDVPLGAVIPGFPIEFTYAMTPSILASETDDFTTVTGLQLAVKDVIVTGAASALVTSQELSRLEMSSVEQKNTAQLVAPSAALTSSSFLEKRFQTRKAEEAMALRRKWPLRLSGSWI